MNFSGLIGQSDIKNLLTDAIKAGHINHAYLFNGPDGIGKRSFALKFAAAVSCLQPEAGHRCGRCKSCILFNAGNNLDIIEIKPKEGKKGISVDDIRDEVSSEISTAPAFGLKKVFIIDNAESMNDHAQNALLKTLEEPPEYAMIILLCSNAENLLDTIKSRVVRVDFKRYSEGEISEYYRARLSEMGRVLDVDPGLLNSYADGIIGRAEEFISDSELMEKRRSIAMCLGNVFAGDVEAKNTLKEIIDIKGGNFQFAFFTMESLVRDALIISKFGIKAKIQNADFKENLVDLSRTAGTYRLRYAISKIEECNKNLKANAMADVQIEKLLYSI